MKKFPLIIFIFYNSLVCGQLNIKIDLPLDSNVINARTSESYSSKLYVGVKNRFRIEIPNVKTRDIELAFDTKDVDFETIWRPINVNMELSNPLAEWTLMTAERLGAYHPMKIKSEEKYIDTNEIYWEKEYASYPSIAKQYNFTVYIRKSDSLKILHHTATLFSNHIRIPSLSFSSLAELLSVNKLIPIFDEDLINGNDWFKIRSYKFSTFDNNDKLIYSRKCPGDILITSMREALENKKVSYIMLSNITSKKHNYDDIKLFKL